MLSSSRLTAIHLAVHDLKGATGNLMAYATAELADRVQQAAGCEAPETAVLALRLADALDGFLAALAVRVQRGDAGERSSTPVPDSR
jgi:hypothetical protein